LGWTSSDSLIIIIQDGSNVLRTDDIFLSSFTAHNLTQINYFNNCGSYHKDSINGKQLTYIIGGITNGSLSLTFQPALVSPGASWAFTDIRVMTGCNNFMLSTNGSMCNSCSSGYYYNETTYSCHQCHHYCSSCFAGGPDSCLSCPVMSMLNGETCSFSSSFNFVFDRLASSDVDVSTCGSTVMLGGPTYGLVGAVLSRTFNIPRHSFLKVQFSLIRVGSWEGYTLTLNVNGQRYQQINEFNEALISPLCLKELGPTLCAQT